MSRRLNLGEGKGMGGSARYERAKRHGWPNQLAHESEGRAQRAGMLSKMEAGRVKRRAHQRKGEGTGMSGGTMGRSRL